MHYWENLLISPSLNTAHSSSSLLPWCADIPNVSTLRSVMNYDQELIISCDKGRIILQVSLLSRNHNVTDLTISHFEISNIMMTDFNLGDEILESAFGRVFDMAVRDVYKCVTLCALALSCHGWGDFCIFNGSTIRLWILAQRLTRPMVEGSRISCPVIKRLSQTSQHNRVVILD